MDEVNLKGWDFGELTTSGRMTETALPWDYRSIIIPQMQKIRRMLDMGTGGGEFLKTLAPLPFETFATEGYEPNVKIAEENLSAYGVNVISGYKDSALPFENDFFELIINRHEFYEPAEVNRILKPGGLFITQQVKWDVDKEIVELLGIDPQKAAAEYLGWCLQKAEYELSNTGLEIIRSEESPGFTYFADSAALISYIKIINWLVPEFSAEKYRQDLKEAEQIISLNGSFRSTLNRFLIIAKKL